MTTTGNSFLDQLLQLTYSEGQNQDQGQNSATGQTITSTPNETDGADENNMVDSDSPATEATEKTGMLKNMSPTNKLLLGGGLAVVAFWLFSGNNDKKEK